VNKVVHKKKPPVRDGGSTANRPPSQSVNELGVIMPELSTEVKKILQRVDEIDRKRAALWRRRERLIMRLERLAGQEKEKAPAGNAEA
jgi:hypothetical protein